MSILSLERVKKRWRKKERIMNKRVTGVGLIEGSSWTQEGHHKAIFGEVNGPAGRVGLVRVELRTSSGQGSVTSSSSRYFALLFVLLPLFLASHL